MMKTLQVFDIDTPQRVSFFFAQIGHESLDLLYVREIASGSAYEGRKDLGNTETGDGIRYKGRGFIQLTGRANYKSFSDFMNEDFVKNPEKVEEPANACASAGWFWTVHKKLNKLADEGKFETVTKRINGGLNGYADRLKRLGECRKALGIK
jgi:putative chitinase